MSYTESETNRRIANIVSVGTVATLDEADATVTVTIGDVTTDPLPWLTTRAGPDRTWWAPEPGEQVVVLAPSGDLAQAWVMPAGFSNAYPSPANARTVHRTVYADGSVVEYDRAAHRLTVTVGTGSVVVNCGTATVNASDSVTVNTPETTFTGNVTVEGQITGESGIAVSGTHSAGSTAQFSGDVDIIGPSLRHNGKNVGDTHTHGGVQTGGSSTTAPNN